MRQFALLDDGHLAGATRHPQGVRTLNPLSTRILVVDDDDTMLDLMSQVLRNQRYEVDTARTFEEALPMALEEDYRGLLLDLILPDANGLSLYRQIARRRPELAPRVVFVTGMLERSEVKRFTRLVDNPLILKPFKLDDLIAAVRRATDLPVA